jgi:RNA polymerase sigma-70 factor, ECF subfamily
MRPQPSRDEHVERLFRAAYALRGSRRDAERLVEEAFARALREDSRDLMRALRDAWIELERARPAGPATSRAEAVDWVGDHDGLVSDAKAAYRAMRELSPHLREAIAAVDVAGLSYRQAARALGIRRKTLHVRVARAREHVSAALEDAP